MRPKGKKIGRPKSRPWDRGTQLKFYARPFELAAIELIGAKRSLDMTNVMRYALTFLIDHEGLRQEVEQLAREKAAGLMPLPDAGRLAQGG